MKKFSLTVVFLSRWLLSSSFYLLSFCKELVHFFFFFFFLFFLSNSKQLLPVVLQEGTQLHLLPCGCRSGRTSRGEFGHYSAERKTVYHWHHVCIPTLRFHPSFFSEPIAATRFFKKSQRMVLQDSLFELASRNFLLVTSWKNFKTFVRGFIVSMW